MISLLIIGYLCQLSIFYNPDEICFLRECSNSEPPSVKRDFLPMISIVTFSCNINCDVFSSKRVHTITSKDGQWWWGWWFRAARVCVSPLLGSAPVPPTSGPLSRPWAYYQPTIAPYNIYTEPTIHFSNINFSVTFSEWFEGMVNLTFHHIVILIAMIRMIKKRKQNLHHSWSPGHCQPQDPQSANQKHP